MDEWIWFYLGASATNLVQMGAPCKNRLIWSLDTSSAAIVSIAVPEVDRQQVLLNFGNTANFSAPFDWSDLNTLAFNISSRKTA
jgi:hypothetical protein